MWIHLIEKAAGPWLLVEAHMIKKHLRRRCGILSTNLTALRRAPKDVTDLRKSLHRQTVMFVLFASCLGLEFYSTDANQYKSTIVNFLYKINK